LPPLAIPATLHDSLMARLDRLATVKAVAQLGAVLGRTFSYELLQAVTPLDETLLQDALARLVDAELLYQRGVPPQATYLFKHALIQDAAYQSLLKSTRQQCHQQIAQVLEARFPALVDTKPGGWSPSTTRSRLCCAGTPLAAAGQLASDRSAHWEAISHEPLDELLAPRQRPERIQQLALHYSLGASSVIAKGYGAPRWSTLYTRHTRCVSRWGESPELVKSRLGCGGFMGTGTVSPAREPRNLLPGATFPDPALLVVAHRPGYVVSGMRCCRPH
jgi:hypothetical protein